MSIWQIIKKNQRGDKRIRKMKKEKIKINKDFFKDLAFNIDVGIREKPDECEVCKVEKLALNCPYCGRYRDCEEDCPRRKARNISW